MTKSEKKNETNTAKAESGAQAPVRIRIIIFWVLLIGFFVWDWHHANPINLRQEAPVIAVGSGKAPSGGHCATF